MTRDAWWSCACGRHTYSVGFVRDACEKDETSECCGTGPVRQIVRTKYRVMTRYGWVAA